ncbi:hypothetical protein BJ944DRAFT_284481 [Cunninghamella echinulata]|nr:hypothetical protein BJ944DRAFT_284481 [Cunninghamella echinulata]
MASKATLKNKKNTKKVKESTPKQITKENVSPPTHKYATRSKVKPKVIDIQVKNRNGENNTPTTSSANTNNITTASAVPTKPLKRKHVAKQSKNNSNKKQKGKAKTKEKGITSSITSTVATSFSTPSSSLRRKRQPVVNSKTKRFASLPPEILRSILSNLTIKDLYNTALASKRLLNIVRCQPIWHHILTVNNKKSQNRYSDMSLVIRQHRKICEKCYKITTIQYGSQSPLETKVHEEHNHYLRLCLQCRKNHYHRHPEDIEEIAKKELGEEMKEDYRAEDLKIAKGRAKTLLKLNDDDLTHISHIDARNPYGGSFAPMKLYQVDELIEAALEKHGGYVGLLAEREKIKMIQDKRVETSRIRFEEHEREAKEREALLVQKLAEKDLTLRHDSTLCNEFIDKGKGDVDKIAVIMKEMDWYYRCTNYSTYIMQQYEAQSDSNDDSEDNFNFGSGGRRVYWVREGEHERKKISMSDNAKKQSLSEWTTRRTKNNNFQSPRDDEDNDQRPPSTLWNRIDMHLKSEVVRFGASILPDSMKKNKDYFGRKARRSSATRVIVKNYLNSKSIRGVKTSNGIAKTFGALVSAFYNHPDTCYNAVAVHVPTVQ